MGAAAAGDHHDADRFGGRGRRRPFEEAAIGENGRDVLDFDDREIALIQAAALPGAGANGARRAAQIGRACNRHAGGIDVDGPGAAAPAAVEGLDGSLRRQPGIRRRAAGERAGLRCFGGEEPRIHPADGACIPDLHPRSGPRHLGARPDRHDAAAVRRNVTDDALAIRPIANIEDVVARDPRDGVCGLVRGSGLPQHLGRW